MLRRSMGQRRPGRRFTALFLAVVLAATVGACGPEGERAGPAGSPSPSPPPFGSGDIMDESRASAQVAYQGTYKSPDPTPRPAAKGKKIVIISGGQLSPTSSIPVAGAAEAARELGWTVTVLDMQFNPANGGRMVKEAINAGADGIVVNFDCMLAPTELAEARAKGIKTIPLYGFDCDDQSSGRPAGQPLFTTFINYGLARVDAPRYTAGFGVLTASTIITSTNGTAKVISFTDQSLTVLRYVQAGFEQQMGRCKGCAVLETVTFSTQDLINGGLEEKATAALRRHPDATVVRTPFSAATHAGIAAAVVKAGRHNSMLVVGGEGFPQDLDLIRTRQGLSSLLVVDSTWTGWSVVDALNSHFVGEEPRTAGFGTVLVDRDHNLPPSGPVRHNVDFKTVYRKAWGVE